MFHFFSHDAVRRIPKMLVIAYKRCLSLKIKTVTKFLLFSLKLVIDGVCLFDY